MKDDFEALWALIPASQRREPTPSELAGGFPCGALDQKLFNELMFRLSQMQREIVYAVVTSGQTPNQNDTTQLWKAILSGLSTQIINILNERNIIGGATEDYIDPGTFIYTVPPNTYLLSVLDVIGGGGGGGGAKDSTTAASAGAGGAHGQGKIIPVTPGEKLTIVVPDGGVGGIGGASADNGTAGGTAQIKRANGTVLCAATGGGGGYRSLSGVQTLAALGGVASGCFSNDTGVTGGLGYPSSVGLIGGLGGACPSGGGGTPGPNYLDVGKPGLNYGGGGNGSSTNGAGGNGAGGRVRFAH
jgi:hypothetical protein